MIDPARTPRCDRVRARASLAPDGELSVLEQRLVAAHLARCADCRAFSTDVAAVAAELRAARALRPGRRFALPAAAARRTAYARARAVGAVAVVAAMAFGIALRAPLPAGEDGVSTPDATAASAGAEQTIRQLRREALLAPVLYSDRPARSFGNQPA